MAGTTYSRFFWSDWRSDPCLKLCSFAAKGLWIDMLACMAETKGYLVLPDGSKPTEGDIAAMIGCRGADITEMLAELAHHRVYSVDRRGVIYSRRIVRDEKKRRSAALGGKIAGSANRDRKRGIFASMDGGVLPESRVQSPESRVQEELNLSGSNEPSRINSVKTEQPKPPPKRSPQPPQTGQPPLPVPEPAEARDLARDFADWYREYPRKVARGAAEKAYRAARRGGERHEDLVAGLRRYVISVQHEDPSFTKHPATWLNGKCWLDEVPKARAFGSVVALRPIRRD